MFPSQTSIKTLVKSHPHTSDALNFFVPLLRAQQKSLEKNNPIAIPSAEAKDFANGKPLFVSSDLPYADAFLKTSITGLVNAMMKVLPDKKEELNKLKDVLRKNLTIAKEIVTLRLAGKVGKIGSVAKKHNLNKECIELLSMLLAGTIGQSVRIQVVKNPLPEWTKGYCPICGSAPHGSLLKEKEGQRFLHCGLCGHEWRHSRTTCPSCGQQDVKKISLFYFEDKQEERGEGCDACKQYLLSIDTRKLAEPNLPPELYFLSMAPLDFIMQEKGYTPVSASMFQ